MKPIYQINRIKTTVSVIVIILSIPYSLRAQQQVERISINVQNISVKDFITRVEKLTKLEFVFVSSDLNEKQRITYQAENKPLAKVLDEVLKPIGLDFKINNGIISIFRLQAVSTSSTSTSTENSFKTLYASDMASQSESLPIMIFTLLPILIV